MLDMFSQENAAGAKPTMNEGDRLPATFGGSFDAAWNDMDLFSNSDSAFSARTQALNEYVGMVQRAGGNYEAHLPKPSELQKRYPVGIYSEEDKLNAANGALAELGAQYAPPPMTMDDLGRRADELMAGARISLQAQQSRPQNLASRAGGLLGTMVGGLTDPLNLPLMVMAPELGGANVLKAALGWGAVFAGQQFLNEFAGMRARERALPGYAESGAPAENIAEAAVGGAIMGGTLKGFANVLERIHTGQWPRTLKDAANVVKSEDNIAKTNVLPGAEGDGEHRAALSTAMDQILRGQPVDVDIGEASRAVMARAEAERQGFVMPRSANMAEISRLSEEGGLATRRSEILQELATMPAGDLSAADRLNRLEAVENQLSRAETPAERKALLDRRDQILVDTNPEQLQKAAQPIQDRQALEQEHANISSRLDEIGEERAREQLARATAPTMPREVAPAPLAQAERVPRTLFDIHEQRIGDLAAVRSQPETLTPGIQRLALGAGYSMPEEEAARLAERIAASGSDDEARAILQQATLSPRTVLATTPSASEVRRAEQGLSKAITADAQMTALPPSAIDRARPENIDKILADPKETAAQQQELMRHIDDEAKAGRQAQINVADAEGNATVRTLSSVLDDAANDEKAAAALEACNAEMAE